MPWRDFGPEWNPVLVVLAVLAIACLLGALHWWLGLALVVGLIIAFCLVEWA